MNNLKKMMEKGKETARAERQGDASPLRAPRQEAQREKFGTRALPELQGLLRRDALELQEQRGRRCSVEELLEVLLLEYRDDAELRERVHAQLRS